MPMQIRNVKRPTDIPKAPDEYSVYIPLTKGYFTLIDADDYEWVSYYNWYTMTKSKNGIYAGRKINKGQHTIYLAREIMDCPNDLVVDHINGDALDNRKQNLRICTHRQNMINRRKINISQNIPYRGVTKCRVSGRYITVIAPNRKRIQIGRYDSIEDAARAYDNAAKEVYGQFAKLNFPSQ